jgi:hypothetical protein
VYILALKRKRKGMNNHVDRKGVATKEAKTKVHQLQDSIPQ